MPEDSVYRDDILIDEHNLEKEWVDQPRLYMKWAELHADAIFDKDSKKTELDLKYAQIDKMVRVYPDQYDIDKLTEASIRSAVLQEQEYIDLNNEYLNAIKKVNVMAAAKEAMNHKRSALENLAKLWLGGYYSEPDVPAEAKKKSSKKTDESLNKQLRGSRRLKRKKT